MFLFQKGCCVPGWMLSTCCVIFSGPGTYLVVFLYICMRSSAGEKRNAKGELSGRACPLQSTAVQQRPHHVSVRVLTNIIRLPAVGRLHFFVAATNQQHSLIYIRTSWFKHEPPNFVSHESNAACNSNSNVTYLVLRSIMLTAMNNGSG